jgi:hypothetical protein
MYTVYERSARIRSRLNRVRSVAIAGKETCVALTKLDRNMVHVWQYL